jgi:hypothetical protein
MDDEQLARAVLRNTLHDAQATPADRVRAAQLLLAHGNAPGASGDALAADDAELLRIARGEYPPREGPAAPGNFSVPSDAREVPRGTSEGPTAGSDLQAADSRLSGVVMDDLGRVPAAFLNRGPKKSPVDSPTPRGPPRKRTQKRTRNLTSPGAQTKNGLEPWE